MAEGLSHLEHPVRGPVPWVRARRREPVPSAVGKVAVCKNDVAHHRAFCFTTLFATRLATADWLRAIASGGDTPEILERVDTGHIGAAAAVRDVIDHWSPGKLSGENPPEIHDRDDALLVSEKSAALSRALNSGSGVAISTTSASRRQSRAESRMMARPWSSRSARAGERIVGDDPDAALEEGLHQVDRLRLLGHVRERLVGEAEHRDVKSRRRRAAQLLDQPLGGNGSAGRSSSADRRAPERVRP